MRVLVVASAPEVAVRWPDRAYPAHLPGDLAAALTAAGHAASVHLLPGTQDPDAHAYSGAAEHGRLLAEAVADGDDGQRPVLHALDPAAALACVAARNATGAAVVQRWGALPPAPGTSERRLRAAGLRAADVVVAPSEVLARQARSAGAATVSVVPDGVDCAALAAAAAECDDAPLLVSLSGPDVHGGAREVLAALRALPEARAVVAGRAAPGAADAFHAAADTAGLGDRVEYRGWLPRRDALGLLSRAHVVLAPRPGATSAQVALEAMCRARPVVAADVPVLADAVAHRTTGLLVRPGDPVATAAAVRALLTDPFRREAWGEAGQDRVSATFDWSRIVPLVEAAYELALAAASRGTPADALA